MNLIENIRHNLFHCTITDDLDTKKGIMKYGRESSIQEKYLKALYSVTEKPFDIPSDINYITKYCMMMSCNKYSFIENSIIIQHKLVGITPLHGEKSILFCKIIKPKSNKKYLFELRGLKFDFLLEPLSLKEQALLSIHMMHTYNTEINVDTRKMKVQAYLDRLSFVHNERHALIDRIVAFYDSLINISYTGIERILKAKEEIEGDDLFLFPLIFYRDLEIQLAFAYKENGCYDKALPIFAKYDYINDEVECLSCLNRNEQAIIRLQKELQKLVTSKKFADKVTYCKHSVRLGWMTNNCDYFDMAYNVYKSYEPLEQKAIFYFKNEQYEKAEETYKQTLVHSPCNEKLLFAYGSVKIILHKYDECVNIFRDLVSLDSAKVEYQRNLGTSLLSTGKVSEGMEAFKRIIHKDTISLALYFEICKKLKNKDGILLYLRIVGKCDNIENVILDLVGKGVISLEEAKRSASSNPYLKGLNL